LLSASASLNAQFVLLRGKIIKCRHYFIQIVWPLSLFWKNTNRPLWSNESRSLHLYIHFYTYIRKIQCLLKLYRRKKNLSSCVFLLSMLC
jgi:hypothetical protein